MVSRCNTHAAPQNKGRLCTAAYLAALLFMLPACTLEVELEGLAPENPAPAVVEGRIFLGEEAIVVLTRIGGPDDTDPFPSVTDAKVFLLGSHGKEEELLHLGSGQYRSFEMRGELGIQYSLIIEVGKEQVVGRSSMPVVPIVLDSATHRRVEDENGFNRVQVSLHFQNPPAQADFAWVRVSVPAAGQPRTYYFFYEDGANDGQYQEWPMLLERELFLSDTARAEFFQVEEEVYQLFKSIRPQGYQNPFIPVSFSDGSIFLAPPSNLSANLEGQSPGYFAAAVRTELVVAP